MRPRLRKPLRSRTRPDVLASFADRNGYGRAYPTLDELRETLAALIDIPSAPVHSAPYYGLGAEVDPYRTPNNPASRRRQPRKPPKRDDHWRRMHARPGAATAVYTPALHVHKVAALGAPTFLRYTDDGSDLRVAYLNPYAPTEPPPPTRAQPTRAQRFAAANRREAIAQREHAARLDAIANPPPRRFGGAFIDGTGTLRLWVTSRPRDPFDA